MGYYSQVRYMTTKKGFEKIKELATKRYDDILNEKMKTADEVKAATYPQATRDDIVIKEDGVSCVYRKTLDTDFEVVKETADGKYVMFGFDWVKWMGYDHPERQAVDWAAEHCGEPVRLLMVGEDGADDEDRWGDYDTIEYDMPYVGIMHSVDDDEWC